MISSSVSFVSKTPPKAVSFNWSGQAEESRPEEPLRRPAVAPDAERHRVALRTIQAFVFRDYGVEPVAELNECHHVALRPVTQIPCVNIARTRTSQKIAIRNIFSSGPGV